MSTYSYSPRIPEAGTPKFTEQFNEAPQYQQHHSFSSDNTGVPQYTAELDGRDMHHRLSVKGRYASPSEVASPYPEVVRHEHDEKEVIVPPSQLIEYHVHAEGPAQPKRICGLPAKWFYIVLSLIILLILAVALGVGLGVGLTQLSSKVSSSASSSNQDDEYLIGGAINPKYYSVNGAFNGSGIALASQSFASNLTAASQGSVVLYFQHWEGEIRWAQLSTEGSWLGGSISQVVQNDAKNSTPISAVSYSLNGVSTWHVFYIAKNNTVRQWTSSAKQNGLWTPGPLNDLNLEAFDADEVGLQACWYGDDYGDSDYVHTPLPGSNSSTTSGSGNTSETGMHLWYATSNSTFQQLGWRDGDSAWEMQDLWTGKNGHAGVGCYSWAANSSVTYVMFVNEENTVEFWWKDTNTSLPSTAAHPINKWVNSSIAISNVYPSTSLGYTNYFYAQNEADLLFYGHDITWAAENTSFSADSSFAVGSTPGLPGTHLSVTALPNQGGGNSITVFYQTVGDDVTEFTRDIVAGQWSTVDIAIPQ